MWEAWGGSPAPLRPGPSPTLLPQPWPYCSVPVWCCCDRAPSCPVPSPRCSGCLVPHPEGCFQTQPSTLPPRCCSESPVPELGGSRPPPPSPSTSPQHSGPPEPEGLLPPLSQPLAFPIVLLAPTPKPEGFPPPHLSSWSPHSIDNPVQGPRCLKVLCCWALAQSFRDAALWDRAVCGTRMRCQWGLHLIKRPGLWLPLIPCPSLCFRVLHSTGHVWL